MILAILLGDAFPRYCPILAQSGRRDRLVGHSGVSSGLVRWSLCSLSAGLPTPPLHSSCQLDSAPGEGCLTEVWPEASGHTRLRNEMVRRGNHNYGEGGAASVDGPSRCVAGPARAALSPCQGVLLANLLPQDKESWHLGAYTGPVLAGTPVKGRGVLGAHVLDLRHDSDPGRLSVFTAKPAQGYP